MLDPELYQLIEIGKHHSCAPHSQLNIAIGPLVQAWRIGFEDAPHRIKDAGQRIACANRPATDPIGSRQGFFEKSWN